jgi:hypothetical protein
VQTEEDVIAEVEEVLAAIVQALRPEDRPVVERYAALIQALNVTSGQFSAEKYVAHEVASAMQD